MSMDYYEQYDKIYRYCYRRLHHRELAEDVTQEAFLRLFAAEGYRETGKAIRYLYTVARNLCIDEYRRPPTQELPVDLPSPHRPDDRVETIALRQALGSLTEEEQELLLLRYVNQEPVSVIAGLLGISRFAVYRKTTAALAKLRQMLKEDEP